VEQGGTRLVWEYNVAGYMRYEIPVIARAVDGVIGLQAKALADLLGPGEGANASSEAPKPDEDAPPAEQAAEKPAAKPAPAKSEPPAKPKVEAAFSDLSDK